MFGLPPWPIRWCALASAAALVSLAGCGNSGTTVAPAIPAPSGLQATPAWGQVALSWNPVSGAASYAVYWSTAPGAGKGGAQISRVQSPFVHTGLTGGARYYYVVTAVFYSGESGASNEAAATVPVRFTTGQAAATVIGQPDFASGLLNAGAGPTAQSLAQPRGQPGVQGDALYLPDSGNGRILGFNAAPTANYAAADFALGSGDLVTASNGTSATAFNAPQSVAVSGGRLFAADRFNQRVLIWNAVPAATNTPADLVVGQGSLTAAVPACNRAGLSGPESVAVTGTRLIVADSNQHRVLVWNTIPTASGTPADLVLGQADFLSCNPNRGPSSATPGAAAGNTLQYPIGVWSDGARLIVADSLNNRVLIWRVFPTRAGQDADVVLGQMGPAGNASNGGGAISAAGLNQPSFLDSNGTQLAVADSLNNRVLIWNSVPTANDTPAQVVLGSSDFTTTVFGVSPTSINGPGGILFLGQRLVLGDTNNNRYLIFQGQ